MNSSGKASKKIVIGLGVFFGLILLAMVVVPLVVDVDSYRPKIVGIANENINGRLTLGKLSLSLWGQIRVNVDGLTLTDSRDQKVMSVKDVYFHVPFLSLLTGSPVLTFKTTNPELIVIKNKAGKLNLLTLVKEQPKTAAGAKAEAAKPGATPEKSATHELPSIVRNARLGVEMKKAQLTYKDEATGLVSEVKDLDVVAKDISLSRKMELTVTASLDTKMGKTMNVKGPAKLTLSMLPKFNGSQFESTQISMNGNLDGVEISLPGLFEKKAGLATNASANLLATEDSVTINDCTAKFFNAEIKTSGNVKGFSYAPEPSFDIRIKSNDVDLKPWNALIPSLKEYDLGGVATFSAEASGSASKPKYLANMSLKNGTAKAPHLKAQPKFDAFAKIVTDNVEAFAFTMTAPSNDLKISGKVASFTKPKVDVSVTSSGMDLDALIDFPPPAAPAKTGASAPGAPAAGEGKGATGTVAEQDLDALLDPLRQNPIARDLIANLKLQMAFVKAKNVKISDIGGTAVMKGLALNVDGVKMNVFNGTIKAGMQAQLAPKTPTYHLNLVVDKLDLQKAVESQFAMFKNTLTGIATFKMDGSGASFNTLPAKKNLTASGHFEATGAKFATIDIGKVVVEAITKSIDGIAAKVPALKGKSLGTPPNIDSRYSIVSSDFTINGGRFAAPNFVGKAEPNKGLDLKGDTKVGILDLAVDANWEIIDTYNLTKAKDLSVDFQGIHVEHILADADGFVHIPIKVGGTCAAPQVSYVAAPEALGRVALNNTTKAMSGKAKAEAKKQLENVIQKQAPPQVQEALKKFGGKLFGN